MADDTKDPIAHALARLVPVLWPNATHAVQQALVKEQHHSMTEPSIGRVLARVEGAHAAILVVYEPNCSRAALMGLTPYEQAGGSLLNQVLGDACAQTALGAATTVVTGGPPGAYLVSGIDARDTGTVDWFLKLGFASRSTHVDIIAAPRAGFMDDARVRRADGHEIERLTTWVAHMFAPSWGREVARALTFHQGVFVAGPPGEYLGFAAHSGNNAAVGTFGPLGVIAQSRGNGLGAALAQAALADLGARGFARVTIPWVHPARVEFYQRLVYDLEVIPRVVLQWTPKS